MDQALKELNKLKTSASKGKPATITDALDSLLQSLNEAKAALENDTETEKLFNRLAQTVDTHKKEVEDRQKEVYGSLSRIGKALDKQFSASLPTYPNLFSSESSEAALERTIALHFLKTGQFSVADTFLEESGINVSPEVRPQFVELYRILAALRSRDTGPALEWVTKKRSFLQSRSSPLEFLLHRSRYLHLLLSGSSDVPQALSYANTHLHPFYLDHPFEFKRLMGCIIYLPLSRLLKSPYADLASPSHWLELEPLFAKEYCASLGMSRPSPLKVVGDIGGTGALARIEKGRKVMRERKSEWSQTNELPIEIPLPPENRYHSIFACPVSKEQSTDQNPPMMMTCGHVITKESLQKLSKPGGYNERRVKCPYCPQESPLSAALRVYF